MDAFHPIIHIIGGSEPLQVKYLKEMEFYFGCIIGVLRFLEGVSWGYSSLLSHKELDDEN
jgi:hypothetical protein